MAGRPILALLSLVLLAAAVLFEFFVILSGAVNGSPEPHFYFLSADTSRIQGAPARSAWTFFAVCGITGSSTHNCRNVKAALPFRPDTNFGTTRNVPPSLVGSSHYYYLSRFMFAFFLIALFFSVIALFSGLLALCTKIGSYLSGFLTLVALFFQAIGAALMTAWTVQGRNAFNNYLRNPNAASLGKYSYGFVWGTVAALFLSAVLFCVGGSLGGRDKTYSKKSRFGAFGRKRSTRSRGGGGGGAGSFRDAESGRVKSDYS